MFEWRRVYRRLLSNYPIAIHAVFFPVDFASNYEDLRTFVEQVLKTMAGRTGILMNNAGAYQVGRTEVLSDSVLDAKLGGGL